MMASHLYLPKNALASFFQLKNWGKRCRVISKKPLEQLRGDKYAK